ncbi:HepT-like ribonuclease domain-containing protein [Congzhengia minquanensis]|uniref:DUF86 domain-containing protein n=1 Tax=Congzhengia minquanensis TaxID=2763657 RepID=A0A926DLX5_9FIRM|nr:HepT-like ribonuclease domain-containing protein [Congzhengia minquanensis]MBC8540266.1 DUF86 domain-containing protein [Congzhengia minquanensis]
MNDRDMIVLKKMVQYADEIALTVEKLNLDFIKFETDFIAKNAISMCILQIGELVGKLSDDFKAQYHKMPWRDIKSMRNIAAHNYGELDAEVLWETVSNDISELKIYCEAIIAGKE